MKFGSYAIVGPVSHYFEKEPKWYWTIKGWTSGMEFQMQSFMISNRIVFNTQGERKETPPHWMEIAYREIALCFGGTNISLGDVLEDADREGKGEEELGHLILQASSSVPEIEKVLMGMPPDMVMEIWRAVGEVNPTVGPRLIQPAKSEQPS